MIRRIDNPPNPFQSQAREYLAGIPEVKVRVFEEHARSILSENDSPDIPFRWSVNPYRGCQHACAYCYARPYHEYLDLGAGTDFDTQLFVKVNAPELLHRAITSSKWRHEQVNFSGVTDCYQPLESVWELTKRCLEVCDEQYTPASVITKSYLVLRDRELLAALNERVGACVFCSIPFFDDALAKKIEPYAPPPSKRFEAMSRLHACGVPVHVMVAPVIPGLNDKDIPRILQRASACGAEAAVYAALRLPGSVESVFLSRLKAVLPERATRVERRIREIRHGGAERERIRQADAWAGGLLGEYQARV